jgi:hypothetical protein
MAEGTLDSCLRRSELTDVRDVLPISGRITEMSP